MSFLDISSRPVCWPRPGAPSYITEPLHYHQNPQEMQKLGDRASVAAPRLWNSLPEAIRKADSVEAFKKLLKTHFYVLAFN